MPTFDFTAETKDVVGHFVEPGLDDFLDAVLLHAMRAGSNFHVRAAGLSGVERPSSARKR